MGADLARVHNTALVPSMLSNEKLMKFLTICISLQRPFNLLKIYWRTASLHLSYTNKSPLWHWIQGIKLLVSSNSSRIQNCSAHVTWSSKDYRTSVTLQFLHCLKMVEPCPAQSCQWMNEWMPWIENARFLTCRAKIVLMDPMFLQPCKSATDIPDKESLAPCKSWLPRTECVSLALLGLWKIIKVLQWLRTSP